MKSYATIDLLTAELEAAVVELRSSKGVPSGDYDPLWTDWKISQESRQDEPKTNAVDRIVNLYSFRQGNRCQNWMLKPRA